MINIPAFLYPVENRIKILNDKSGSKSSQTTGTYITNIDGIRLQLRGTFTSEGFKTKSIYPIIRQKIDGYYLEEKIGVGLSVVYRCSKEGKVYALKFFMDLPLFQYESETLMAIAERHPKLPIPKVHDTFKTKNFAVIIMDYYPKSVPQAFPMTNQTFLKLAKQLLVWLVKLQGYNAVHCDLKPQNLCLDENDDLRVIDFGMAHPLGRKMKGQSCSVFYRHPYIYRNYLSGYVSGIYIDMWATGMTLLEMINGGTPDFLRKVDYYDEETFFKMIEELDFSPIINDIVRKKITNKKDQDILIELLTKLLEKDITKTICASDALRILTQNHCYFFLTKGGCKKGDKCPYIHEKSCVCPYYLSTNCILGDDCKKIH